MRKPLKLAAILSMAALVLTACGSSTAAPSATTSPQETVTETPESKSEAETEAANDNSENGTYDGKITKGRTVKIVTSGGSLPYSLINGDLKNGGTWEGIDSEMWAEIAKRTGWTLDIMQAAGHGATFGQVDAGRADVASNCYAVNADRVSKYAVSHPYYGDAQCVAVLPESEIKTLDDLKNKKVGVLNGQAAQKTITELGEKNGFEVTAYEGDNSVAGYQDVVLGRIDAFASTDSAVYKWESTTNNDLRLLDERLYANDVAFYFPKTEEGKKLRDEVNVVLDDMMADGTVSEIVTKYMYQDMTKLIKPYDELGFTID
ncbi:periplasmic component of amino acid ABC-type transporter/signal transduction system [Lachnospiraceae bacterium JC7]|nr:periplasmic component of amino acid ABC-type transporter/signal transduction system [Lachnospiraceae bacterium JC7]